MTFTIRAADLQYVRNMARAAINRAVHQKLAHLMPVGTDHWPGVELVPTIDRTSIPLTRTVDRPDLPLEKDPGLLDHIVNHLRNAQWFLVEENVHVQRH